MLPVTLIDAGLHTGFVVVGVGDGDAVAEADADGAAAELVESAAAGAGSPWKRPATAMPAQTRPPMSRRASNAAS
jgi:hypothetical protein